MNLVKAAGTSSKKRKREDQKEDGGDDTEDGDEEEEDVTKLTIKALKEKLKDAGLKISGNKKVLIQRLKKHLAKKARSS